MKLIQVAWWTLIAGFIPYIVIPFVPIDSPFYFVYLLLQPLWTITVVGTAINIYKEQLEDEKA